MPGYYGFIPWTPRNVIRKPEVAPSQNTPTPTPANETLQSEMLQFRTALMKVINGFPDAKKAVIAYLVKASNLPGPPAWAT